VAVAWVGDDGEGAFSAHVEYDEPGPFCLLNGPTEVTLEEALAWARGRAERVILRIGDVHYNAGVERAPNLPSWPSTAERAPRPATTGQAVAWSVQARTGWYRRDRDAVARRLAQAVGDDARAADATQAVDELGFSVSFTVWAPSELEAHEMASGVARDAWATARIMAEPGEDFDVSSIVVQSA
jgi:hypothetical protein